MIKGTTRLLTKFVKTAFEDGFVTAFLKAISFIRLRIVKGMLNIPKHFKKDFRIYYYKGVCPILPIIHPSENSGSIQIHPFEQERFLIVDSQMVDCVYENSPTKLTKYLNNGIGGRERRMFNKYAQKDIKEYELDGRTVIDVGARIGISSRMFLHRGAAKVIAVEADPSPARCLRRNLTRYKSNRCEIHEVALNNESGEGTFYLQTSSSDSSLIRPSQSSKPIQIKMMRLDELINEDELDAGSVMKIDAEGAEPEVLQGAEDILDKLSIITVRASYERGSASGEGEHTLPECEEILRRNGFECQVYDDDKQLIARKESN